MDSKGKFFFIILFLLLTSCLNWFLEKPTFTPKEVSVTRISSGELNILFGVEVLNPNTFDIRLKALEYAISIHGQEIGKGRMEEEVLISGSSTTLVRVPLQIRFKDLGIPFGFALAGRDLPYKIEGVAIINARLGTATFPFSKAGEIKLKN
jgi:LEA14-like dessication related protein